VMVDMKRKILIVEDNDDCRELLAMCIKRLGYEVCEAVTGIEAIEQASAMHPDLIMMDLNLPEMSGAKATALLKANPGTTDIPVIVNTAHVAGVQTNRALEAGAAEILYKPLDLLKLREILFRYLSTEGERTPAPATEEPNNLSSQSYQTFSGKANEGRRVA
jgi:two-component system cell cycle response regulator DivK